VEQPSKRERYFSGMPLEQDPSKPLPGEVPAGTKANFIRAGVALGLFSLGLIIGLSLGAETPEEAEQRIAELKAELDTTRARVVELNRALSYRNTSDNLKSGVLAKKDRERHLREGKRYAGALRAAKAQAASELIDWFINRWNGLLDRPEDDDRLTRRADLLSRLVGGMAQNLDPDDYVPWQAEFLNGDWLGEVHFDLDGDGFPGKRSRENPRDGFVDQSICVVAMALNQSVTDAQILVQPQMHCDSPKAKISVFLNGRTVDDALTEFVRAVKREGFFTKDRTFKGTRMILIGPGKRAD
jgi:hypothetical protein